jgi:hypothetical protein
MADSSNEIPSVAQRMNSMGAAKGTGITKSSIKQNLLNKPRQQGQARSQQKANPIPYQVPGQAARPEIGTAPAPVPAAPAAPAPVNTAPAPTGPSAGYAPGFGPEGPVKYDANGYPIPQKMPDERFKYKYNPKPGGFRMTPENQAKYEQSAVPMWDGFNTKPQTNLYTEDGMPNAMFGMTTKKGFMGKKDYKPPTPEEIAAGNAKYMRDFAAGTVGDRYKPNPNKGIYVNYAAMNR